MGCITSVEAEDSRSQNRKKKRRGRSSSTGGGARSGSSARRERSMKNNRRRNSKSVVDAVTRGESPAAKEDGPILPSPPLRGTLHAQHENPLSGAHAAMTVTFDVDEHEDAYRGEDDTHNGAPATHELRSSPPESQCNSTKAPLSDRLGLPRDATAASQPPFADGGTVSQAEAAAWFAAEGENRSSFPDFRALMVDCGGPSTGPNHQSAPVVVLEGTTTTAVGRPMSDVASAAASQHHESLTAGQALARHSSGHAVGTQQQHPASGTDYPHTPGVSRMTLLTPNDSAAGGGGTMDSQATGGGNNNTATASGVMPATAASPPLSQPPPTPSVNDPYPGGSQSIAMVGQSTWSGSPSQLLPAGHHYSGSAAVRSQSFPAPPHSGAAGGAGGGGGGGGTSINSGNPLSTPRGIDMDDGDPGAAIAKAQYASASDTHHLPQPGLMAGYSPVVPQVVPTEHASSPLQQQYRTQRTPDTISPGLTRTNSKASGSGDSSDDRAGGRRRASRKASLGNPALNQGARNVAAGPAPATVTSSSEEPRSSTQPFAQQQQQPYGQPRMASIAATASSNAQTTRDMSRLGSTNLSPGTGLRTNSNAGTSLLMGSRKPADGAQPPPPVKADPRVEAWLIEMFVELELEYGEIVFPAIPESIMRSLDVSGDTDNWSDVGRSASIASNALRQRSLPINRM